MEWLVTDDPQRDCWRRLDYFSNQDVIERRIAQLFPAVDVVKQLANIKKQCLQIRACVKQAREYFTSCQSSSLLTRPTLAYYGSVSLASAVMLLRGGGDFALDRLRGDVSNQAHGLRFSCGSNSKTAAQSSHLLANCFVEHTGTGFFKNFYTSLPQSKPIEVFHRFDGEQTGHVGCRILGEHKKVPFALLRRKTSLLGMIELMPDLYSELRAAGTIKAASRGSLEVRESSKDGTQVWQWRLHGASDAENLQALLSEFKVEASWSDHLSCIEHPSSNGAVISAVVPLHSSPFLKMHWPDSRKTNQWEDIYYAESLDRPELVHMLEVMYGLSMLARYYPDVWTATLDANGLSAHLIGRVLDMAMLRIPALALSELVGNEIVLTTTQAPWSLA